MESVFKGNYWYTCAAQDYTKLFSYIYQFTVDVGELLNFERKITKLLY